MKVYVIICEYSHICEDNDATSVNSVCASMDCARERMKIIYHDNVIEGNPVDITHAEYAEDWSTIDYQENCWNYYYRIEEHELLTDGES